MSGGVVLLAYYKIIILLIIEQIKCWRKFSFAQAYANVGVHAALYVHRSDFQHSRQRALRDSSYCSFLINKYKYNKNIRNLEGVCVVLWDSGVQYGYLCEEMIGLQNPLAYALVACH